MGEWQGKNGLVDRVSADEKALFISNWVGR